MNLQFYFGACSVFLLAVLVLQNRRFKQAHPGYLSFMAALEGIQKKSEVATSQLALIEQEIRHQRLAFDALLNETKIKEAEADLLDKRHSQAQQLYRELVISTTAAGANFTLAKERLKSVLDEAHKAEDELAYTKKIAETKRSELQNMEVRSAHLLNLESKAGQLTLELHSLELLLSSANNEKTEHLQFIEIEISKMQARRNQAESDLASIMGRVDLYSRVDEYTQVGHFEVPSYLYDTSVRYQTEIRQIRDQQKNFIRSKEAVIFADDFLLCADKSMNRQILEGQTNLMLFAFNVECDLLTEKVSPGSLDRTLTQIEKKAEQLERSAATMRCGFNIQYVRLKYEECKLQYEYKLKKQEEQDEQRLIREQMKEEVRVQKQYEDAMKEAEKDEIKYRRLIEKARDQLDKETEQSRALTLAKISLLEDDLKMALERGLRAKSMAEQTRRGYVYVISNIGAFGEGIYKIGMTRRLDPQDRVDELGNASVPFRFDVHAMCFSEDAPALESSLHKHFSSHRINAVNLRKEFFRVSLDEIRVAVQERVDKDVEFKFTSHAVDYYETKRLMSV